jgi:hypothetical protein
VADQGRYAAGDKIGVHQAGTARVSHAVPARSASEAAESVCKLRICLIVSPVSPILKLTKECKTAGNGTGISWLSALFAGTGGTSPTNTGIATTGSPETADNTRERCQGTTAPRHPRAGVPPFSLHGVEAARVSSRPADFTTF